jgi:hypothetical protein
MRSTAPYCSALKQFDEELNSAPGIGERRIVCPWPHLLKQGNSSGIERIK